MDVIFIGFQRKQRQTMPPTTLSNEPLRLFL
jgi:hypothetical protein